MAGGGPGWYARRVFETFAFLSTVGFATIFVVLVMKNRAQEREDEGRPK